MYFVTNASTNQSRLYIISTPWFQNQNITICMLNILQFEKVFFRLEQRIKSVDITSISIIVCFCTKLKIKRKLFLIWYGCISLCYMNLNYKINNLDIIWCITIMSKGVFLWGKVLLFNKDFLSIQGGSCNCNTTSPILIYPFVAFQEVIDICLYASKWLHVCNEITSKTINMTIDHKKTLYQALPSTLECLGIFLL